jgi:hypothetical protein
VCRTFFDEVLPPQSRAATIKTYEHAAPSRTI